MVCVVLVLEGTRDLIHSRHTRAMLRCIIEHPHDEAQQLPVIPPLRTTGTQRAGSCGAHEKVKDNVT